MANAVVAQLSAKPTVEERFWAKVSTAGPAPDHRPDLDPCWLWLASRNADGYGRFRLRVQQVLAHRFAYELLVGEILPGLELDHLCRVRHCVNPWHMELVTHQENIQRGIAGLALAQRQRAKTHCPQGHPYDEENTYRYRTSRYCRACFRSRSHAKYERKKDRILVAAMCGTEQGNRDGASE